MLVLSAFMPGLVSGAYVVGITRGGEDIENIVAPRNSILTEAGSGRGQYQNSKERQDFAISSIPSVITH
jgi:hypothetical protein